MKVNIKLFKMKIHLVSRSICSNFTIISNIINSFSWITLSLNNGIHGNCSGFSISNNSNNNNGPQARINQKDIVVNLKSKWLSNSENHKMVFQIVVVVMCGKI
ncbi:hypothetical protein ACTA71_006050 [Dictyostelium dimigraforme]